jgi:hypothetical protein
MDQAGIYLYGIMATDTVPEILSTGIGDAPTYPLLCGDFAALVSRLRPEEADFTTEAVLAHEQVLTSAMNTGTVLPAAFGHLFPDEEALRRFVDGVSGDLRANMDNLNDRVEVGVKAIWRKESFIADIETPELRALINQAQRSQDDPSLSMVVGELVEKLLHQRRSYYVDQICSRLGEEAVEMQLNDSATARVVFQAAFLIPRDGEEAFFRYVEQVVKPYDDRLQITGSGPWPPHNFARLHIDQVE